MVDQGEETGYEKPRLHSVSRRGHANRWWVSAPGLRVSAVQPHAVEASPLPTGHVKVSRRWSVALQSTSKSRRDLTRAHVSPRRAARVSGSTSGLFSDLPDIRRAPGIHRAPLLLLPPAPLLAVSPDSCLNLSKFPRPSETPTTGPFWNPGRCAAAFLGSEGHSLVAGFVSS